MSVKRARRLAVAIAASTLWPQTTTPAVKQRLASRGMRVARETMRAIPWHTTAQASPPSQALLAWEKVRVVDLALTLFLLQTLSRNLVRVRALHAKHAIVLA